MLGMTILDAERLNVLYVLCGLLVLWGGWVKAVRPRLRRLLRSWQAASDALLGRDAIYDSITGEERVPALPGIGQRMSTVEDAMKTLVDAVADQRRLQQHVMDHEARISSLERDELRSAIAQAERAATAASAAEMLHMIRDRDTLDADSTETDDLENS